SYLHFVRAKLKGVNTPPLCGGIKRRSLLLIPRGLPRGGFINIIIASLILAVNLNVDKQKERFRSLWFIKIYMLANHSNRNTEASHFEASSWFPEWKSSCRAPTISEPRARFATRTQKLPCQERFFCSGRI
ncbi:MAG: hypothetical protein UU83_C0026G0011, partial [Candidatus Jorgensenbacteria bacterium GW2011_GWF2_41_8]